MGFVDDDAAIDNKQNASRGGSPLDRPFGLAGKNENSDIEAASFPTAGGQRQARGPAAFGVGICEVLDKRLLPRKWLVAMEGLEELRKPLGSELHSIDLLNWPTESIAAVTPGAEQDRAHHWFVKFQVGVQLADFATVTLSDQARHLPGGERSQNERHGGRDDYTGVGKPHANTHLRNEFGDFIPRLSVFEVAVQCNGSHACPAATSLRCSSPNDRAQRDSWRALRLKDDWEGAGRTEFERKLSWGSQVVIQERLQCGLDFGIGHV
jgi:hypothetical protein